MNILYGIYNDMVMSMYDSTKTVKDVVDNRFVFLFFVPLCPAIHKLVFRGLLRDDLI